ncbi:TetR/AcrR family transcriptional regulator [Rhizobium sp. TH2]|uniref:TetR/AcrR family transcriptional regulator n=1 Tax=Rhizobium sp. TH2 TaxID=2775403 RepID=UPI0021583497|nr:TetR/AcrR family transcriptional regulator [Rhizobium sp. TH2]UVC10458.1 TetR/AcrR family transcriptional regulator [Rhizobium sp. TH2]
MEESKLAVIEPSPRKASREFRRQQLIDATIATLARVGFSRTTLTEVAATAGLSHGLIIFHFQTKEKLLAETLQYMAREYRDNWVGALATCRQTPAARMEALIRADIDDTISAPERMAAWSALWAEAQSRPIYQENCAEFDLEYLHAMEKLCAELTEEGGYPSLPEHTARAIRVTLNGMWFDLMTMTGPYSRQESLGTMFNMLTAFYPRHFDHHGAIECGQRAAS